MTYPGQDAVRALPDARQCGIDGAGDARGDGFALRDFGLARVAAMEMMVVAKTISAFWKAVHSEIGSGGGLGELNVCFEARDWAPDWRGRG